MLQGFLCGSACKEYACTVGHLGSIPGLGRSPGERKGDLLECFVLENSILFDRILLTVELLSKLESVSQTLPLLYQLSLCHILNRLLSLQQSSQHLCQELISSQESYSLLSLPIHKKQLFICSSFIMRL